jgi:phage/plasmid-associated DNA primase
MTMVTKVVRNIREEAKKETDEDRQAEMRKFAKRSETNYNFKALIELAQFIESIAVLPTDLDKDSLLLNCTNGTIDLRTGKLNSHRREDLLTKLAPVAYQADAKAEVWLAFLNRILAGDQAMIDFLQQAIGSCLTGLVSEKAVFFLVGSGNFGKTTLAEIIRKMLGNYTGAIVSVRRIQARILVNRGVVQSVAWTRMNRTSQRRCLPVAVGRPPAKVCSNSSRSSISCAFMRIQLGSGRLLEAAI